MSEIDLFKIIRISVQKIKKINAYEKPSQKM